MEKVEHKEKVPANVSFAVVTVSSTRAKEDDLSGREMISILEKAGNSLAFYAIVKDDVCEIQNALTSALESSTADIIIFSGGTGISKKDVTIEAIRPMFEKEMSGFSTLFAQLSYDEIGSAVLLSRAAAGVIRSKAVFLIPGSPKACRLAMEKIIISEAGHVVKHLRD
jgi:molybdopterin adenylyltransferase